MRYLSLCYLSLRYLSLRDLSVYQRTGLRDVDPIVRSAGAGLPNAARLRFGLWNAGFVEAFESPVRLRVR